MKGKKTSYLIFLLKVNNWKTLFVSLHKLNVEMQFAFVL